MPRRFVALPILLLGALSAAGCGTSTDREQARSAAQRLYTAVRQRDGATACAQMSPDLRMQVVKDQSQPRCSKAALKLSLHGGAPAVVRVYANSAQVQFGAADTVFLSDTRAGWRVDALGCKPQGPGPYDCEEQS